VDTPVFTVTVAVAVAVGREQGFNRGLAPTQMCFLTDLALPKNPGRSGKPSGPTGHLEGGGVVYAHPPHVSATAVLTLHVSIAASPTR
jgi:hypothetical protein